MPICKHKMVHSYTRRCTTCGHILGPREHIHLYGPWGQPKVIHQDALWTYWEKMRICLVGPFGCGETLTRRGRIARNNELSRDHRTEYFGRH